MRLCVLQVGGNENEGLKMLFRKCISVRSAVESHPLAKPVSHLSDLT